MQKPERSILESLRKEYIPSGTDRPKQVECREKMGYGREAFALLCEMRTGKTRMILNDFGSLELNGDCDDLLVIAPGGCYSDWATEEALQHLSDDLRSRLAVKVWYSSGGANYMRSLKIFLNKLEHVKRILVVNIESLSSVRAAREAALEFASAPGRRCMIVIDESPTIGNYKSKRTKFILDQLSRYGDYRRILTGLVTPKNPLQLYTQYEFLDWKILGFRSFFAFRARYTDMWMMKKDIVRGGRTIEIEVPIIKGFWDLDELRDKIEPYSFRCLRSEMSDDLPKKDYFIRKVKMTAEQERIYKEMKKYGTAKIKESAHVTANVVIAQMIRLHQILCGHTVDEQGIEHEIAENRTEAVLELLSEYEGKAVIWCSYDKDIYRVADRLRHEYGDDAVACYWGGNRPTRMGEEQRFKHDPLCRFMVSTPGAGRYGKEWSCADLFIYYSNTDNLDHRMQSEDRGQSVDKMRPTMYVDLQTDDTVDVAFVQSMREKINMSTTINGDNYLEWLI